ncbi:PIG-L family deacetylase, partial [uncultured Salegentibacter sp.]|uniref:PIG-L family deacetylase n=1 Tax=uncultured Salegentibacter sp. TaxID=259320 RepID=UPI0030DDB79F
MRKLFSLLFCFFLLNLHAQEPEKLNASEIFQKIKKLNFLGSVLYIGAHPDDENTRLISYFSNEKHARTAYLSLTRGDGGQNLIGPELREQLGLIRTQELLAAREIDGGEQFFTRANDFGYSKTPEETLKIWDKEKVLSDVVWIIRNFKPDVIINRFDHRTPGSTHGHHTSSALLSLEAFDAAANPNKFPDQLKYTNTHQPKRAYFNTSPWFYDGEEAFEEASKDRFISFDTGVYFPLLGLSNPEIASLSRSQHQSQGFGSTGSRGKQMEYLEPIKGDTIRSQDVFEGIDTSWNKLEGGAEISKILHQVEENYSFTNPAASLPQLLEAYKLIQKLPNEHWRELKTKEIKNIIYASTGLFLEAVASQPSATPKDSVTIKLEAINRSDFPVILSSIELSPNDSKVQPETELKNNENWQNKIALKVPEKTSYTTPYWLEEESKNGMYIVKNRELIGLPERPGLTKAVFKLNFKDVSLNFEKPIVYKYNDAVFGETYQPFEIIPKVSLAFEENVIIFENEESKKVSVKLTSG